MYFMQIWLHCCSWSWIWLKLDTVFAVLLSIGACCVNTNISCASILFAMTRQAAAGMALENLLRWVKVVPSPRSTAILKVNGYLSDWSIHNHFLLLLGLQPSAVQLSLCGWTPCYLDGKKHALKSAAAIIGHTEKFTILPAPLHYLWSPMLEILFDRNNQWAPGIFQPRKDAAFFWKEETSLS